LAFFAASAAVLALRSAVAFVISWSSRVFCAVARARAPAADEVRAVSSVLRAFEMAAVR
jgi:hypothetical protein